MARSNRAFTIVVALLVGANLGIVGSAHAASPTTEVAYGSDAYRYLQVPIGGGPAGFAAVDFDDSAFDTGAAPFGQNAALCSLSVATPWSTDSDLLVRRTVTLPEGANSVTIDIAIDNDVELFWNGSPVGSFVHEGCATNGSFSVEVPDELLVGGANVLAARARDRGGVSYFDLQVTANHPPECDSVVLDHTMLWPPRHQMVTVTASGGSDPEGDPVALAISSVTQDEPRNARADGNTTPDATQHGVEPDQVKLRAERSGRGDGRVYRVAITATDAGGASCSVVRHVGVPHDLGMHSVPIDTEHMIIDSLDSVMALVAKGASPSSTVQTDKPASPADARRGAGLSLPVAATDSDLPATSKPPAPPAPPAASAAPALSIPPPPPAPTTSTTVPPSGEAVGAGKSGVQPPGGGGAKPEELPPRGPRR